MNLKKLGALLLASALVQGALAETPESRVSVRKADSALADSATGHRWTDTEAQLQEKAAKDIEESIDRADRKFDSDFYRRLDGKLKLSMLN